MTPEDSSRRSRTFGHIGWFLAAAIAASLAANQYYLNTECSFRVSSPEADTKSPHIHDFNK